MPMIYRRQQKNKQKTKKIEKNNVEISKMTSAGAVCYCDMRYAVYHAIWYEFFKKIPQKWTFSCKTKVCVFIFVDVYTILNTCTSG